MVKQQLDKQEPLFSGIFLNTSGYALNFPDLKPKERLEPGAKKDFTRQHSSEELEKSDYIARYFEKGYIKSIESIRPTSIEAAPEKQIDAIPTRDVGLKTTKLQREGFDVKDGEDLNEAVKEGKSVVVRGKTDTVDEELPKPDTAATKVEGKKGGPVVITQQRDEEELPQSTEPRVEQAGEVAVIAPPEDEVKIERDSSVEETEDDGCKGKNRFGDPCKKTPPKGYSHCTAHMPEEVSVVYKKERAKAKKKIASRRRARDNI